MNISRRNFIAGFTAVGGAVALQGCHTVPTEDAMRRIGYAFGASTGLVLGQCDIDDKSRNVIVDIVNRGYQIVPAEGQTLWDAWRDVAARHVADLILKGKITATQGDLILTGFELVLKGLKLLVERKPEIGTWGALTVAALAGFCDGFLAAYKPVNGENGCEDGCCEDGCCRLTIDQKAFTALKAATEARTFRLKALRAAVAK